MQTSTLTWVNTSVPTSLLTNGAWHHLCLVINTVKLIQIYSSQLNIYTTFNAPWYALYIDAVFFPFDVSQQKLPNMYSFSAMTIGSSM